MTSTPSQEPLAQRRTSASREGASIVVRVAAEQDLDAVLALRLALVREERARDGAEAPGRSAIERARRAYAEQLASERESTLIAIDGGVAVGVLRCTESGDTSAIAPSRYAFLTSGYVVPSHRQRGVMRLLLAAADEWCRQRRLDEMRLQVQWTNDGGNAAWASLGFAPIELRRRRIVPQG